MCSSTPSAAAFRRFGLGACSPFVPFVGLIAYIVMRPGSYALDREEQELDIALREHQLAQYGTCPQCGGPIEKDFVVCPRMQHAGSQRLPLVPSRSTLIGKCARTAELTSNRRARAPRVTHGASRTVTWCPFAPVIASRWRVLPVNFAHLGR